MNEQICYGAMGLVTGVVESIIAAVIIAIVVGAWRWYLGRKVKISDPEENGELARAENRGGVVAHAVSGTLKSLPQDHRAWLLVLDDVRGKVWPQGFEPVAYDKGKGRWKGYVHVWGWNHVTIIAVVAPPTSQEFFSYFQRVGYKTGFEALLNIPRECKMRATVHARVPKAETPDPPAAKA